MFRGGYTFSEVASLRWPGSASRRWRAAAGRALWRAFEQHRRAAEASRNHRPVFCEEVRISAAWKLRCHAEATVAFIEIAFTLVVFVVLHERAVVAAAGTESTTGASARFEPITAGEGGTADASSSASP